MGSNHYAALLEDTPEARGWPAEDILEQHLVVAHVLRPALEGVITRHPENPAPVILEGDYLLPFLAGELAIRAAAPRGSAPLSCGRAADVPLR